MQHYSPLHYLRLPPQENGTQGPGLNHQGLRSLGGERPQLDRAVPVRRAVAASGETADPQ